MSTFDEREADLVRDRAQVRLDRLARLAPRRPEVDDDRHGGGEHLVRERLVRDLAHWI